MVRKPTLKSTTLKLDVTASIGSSNSFFWIMNYLLIASSKFHFSMQFVAAIYRKRKVKFRSLTIGIGFFAVRFPARSVGSFDCHSVAPLTHWSERWERWAPGKKKYGYPKEAWSPSSNFFQVLNVWTSVIFFSEKPFCRIFRLIDISFHWKPKQAFFLLTLWTSINLRTEVSYSIGNFEKTVISYPFRSNEMFLYKLKLCSF